MGAAAAVGAGVAAAGIAGAAISADAAGSAADTQAAAADRASAATMSMYEQNKALISPYVEAGYSGLSSLEGLLGLSGDGTTALQALEQTPGYQFTLQQGLESTQNSYAAKGLASSGAAIKGGANYAENLASTTYQSMISDYANLANLGATSANALAGYGTSATNTSSSELLGGAQAKAAGTTSAAGAYSSGLNSLSSGLTLAALGGAFSNGTSAFGGSSLGSADSAFTNSLMSGSSSGNIIQR